MRVTIIPDDQSVGVNGEFISPIELPELDSSIHAVQWHEEWGEVEFKTQFQNGKLIKPANQIITDFAPFQFAVDAWEAAKAALPQPDPEEQLIGEEPDAA